MHTLSENYKILRFCGVWRPRGWSSGWKKILYGAYTIFIIFLVYSFALSELIEFLFETKNAGAATNDLFLLLTVIAVSYKIGNFVYKREEIMKLVDMFNNGSFRARGIAEMEIQKNSDKLIRNNTLWFSMFVGAAVTVVTIDSFFVHIPKRSLPFKAWLPFDYTTDLGYSIAFPHQILAHILVATIGVIHDTIFHGLMIHASSRLEILKSRLRSIPKAIEENYQSRVRAEIREREEVGKCVRFHQEISKFVKQSNDIFSIVIFVQFSVSTFVICMSTYILTKLSFLSAGFIYLTLYLGNMLIQIYLMCWYGNEVIVESIDVGAAVYDMDWNPLKRSTKNDLRFIMMRSRDPLKYKSGHILNLSLDSYNNLMKLSYSIFNVLQGTSLQKELLP